MRLKKYSLLLLLVLLVNTITAQKYIKTDSKTVTKEWKGYTFSSSKPLVENISEVSELSSLKLSLIHI